MDHDKIFREKLIALIKEHEVNADKVISKIKVNWTRSGKNLMVNGYAFEYEKK